MLMAVSSQANDRFADVKIKATALKGAVHMLQGAGGNIGVSAGEDGILIIDDQYAPLAEKIAAALGELGSDSPRYIVNTHYHGDHTGANAFFHEHKDSTIFAHKNVRVRLANDDKVSAAALPVVTYAQGLTLHFNGETVHVMHLPDGHTDGDSAVWFEEPDVLHTGDLFFNERFPYIDLKGGGSVTGYIESVKTLLAKIDDDTVVIPGHGPLADKADYQQFLDMIEATREIVLTHKREGKTVEEVVAAGLGDKWQSWSWKFITEEKWIRTLYQ
ncbi:MBL fold metallo-hydrolase [Alteromonas sp. ASW11-19]|uniref:MBL fold metallo-hydrolase n=2 Tax=Alteromonas salexigens TaxID=2982530 RepID=A0ABT2VKB9_9ALTE|nr:MBL fold metallo-hydrolase [Alteromonas salexigens]MCU7553722.1 MBL fold metallo-hydrolase [Alteromonas salexigens]